MKIPLYDNGKKIDEVDESDCEIDSWGGARISDRDNECKLGKVIRGKYNGCVIATDGNETYAY